MSGVYRHQPEDRLEQLVKELESIRGRLATLEMPTGTQIFEAKAKLEEALNDIGTYVDAYLATGFTTGSMTATGSVTAGSVSSTGNITSTGGTGDFAAGLTSVGAAGLDLSTIPGTRQTVWQHIASGRYGFAPSTIESKTNLSENLPFTAQDVYATIPLVYEYVAQVAIRDDPENEYYNPTYEVPTEIGLVAEQLVARNMGIFVIFNEDGQPKTIDYPLFGAIANLVAVRDLDARLTAAGL